MKKKVVKKAIKKSVKLSGGFLRNLIKKSGNDMGSIMAEETLSNTTDWIPTGSLALNGLLSGDINRGIANNKIIAFAGENGTGKTFLVLEIAKEAIKKGYEIIYFDSENSTENEMVVKRGIDSTKIAYLPIDTVENFRDQIVKIVNDYNDNSDADKPKLMIILDSLGNLSTKKELADVESGSEKKDMTRSQVIKSIFRVLSLKLAKAKIPLLMTNHTYADMGSFIPRQIMSGGSGLKYSASSIIHLTKSKAKDKNKNVCGFYFRCVTVKNRFCKPDAVVKIYLDFKDGLHKFYGLQEYGSPVLEKASRGWTLNDEAISENNLFNKLDWSTSQGLLETCGNAIHKSFAFGGADEADVVLESGLDD